MAAKETSNAYAMSGGNGLYSYTKNSNHQKDAADRAKATFMAAVVENLDIEYGTPTSKTYRITDLGCSVGPNTFIAVGNIIEAIQKKYEMELGRHSCGLPEFQVFFNDHVSNDFNTLFMNLPPERQYLVAGVPGSFYGRLFPKSSLNFVYSCFALQWLSKAPEGLGDSNSPSCNKGRIDYANAPKHVGEAYAAQFAKDMESFLGARAQEVAPRGLMAILIPGRPDGTLPAERSTGPLFHPLASCLADMANEGIISEAEIDSFNLPIYSPSPEEMRMIIQRNGCFGIAKLELKPEMRSDSPPATGDFRAGMEEIFRQHFGSEIVEQLFNRYTKKFAGRPPHTPADDGFMVGLFILLKRNP
ncbi:hypothetical protein L1049_015192 [Liquidambar formosana]|uniref:S-adenosylmethionine-dependent methyltransferase n=1 Tax=Liquidambar formosana TaxID=63359 RepID=A0AAP0S4D2_LIQFO